MRTKNIKEVRDANPRWGTSRKRKPPPLLEQLSILEYQKFKCERCGILLEKNNTEFDHVVPYHIRPTHFYVALCRLCNRAKAGKIILDPQDD